MNNNTPAVLTGGSPNERKAIEYAERYGWYILPIDRTKAKKPIIVAHGKNSATTNPDIIRGWYRLEPEANIGVVCRPSGLLVLDVDDRHGGDDHLYDLEQKLGPLPDTVCSQTGNGLHIVFRNPLITTKREIAAGIHIRDNAYVIAPNSTHYTGRPYLWQAGPDEMEIEQLPDTWLAATRQASKRYQHVPTKKGRRNNQLVSFAGSLRRQGFDADQIEAMLAVANQDCHPKMEPKKLREIAEWAATKQAAPDWKIDPCRYVTDLAAHLATPGTETLSANDRLVLMRLCWRARAISGWVVGGAWLERETGLSHGSVSKSVARLEDLGLLRVKRQHRRTNQIWLYLPDLPLDPLWGEAPTTEGL
jgi:hypothetical protein